MNEYFISYDDFSGEHSRSPQTFIVNGPGMRTYYRAENYGGSAYAAEQAALHAMKGFNCLPLPEPPTVIHPIDSPIDHICGQWTLDQLLGSEGKRP